MKHNRKNDSELVNSFARRLLTAKGISLEHKLIKKAAKMNGTYNGAPDFEGIRQQIISLFRTLAFDKRMSYDEINEFYKSIDDKILIKGLYSN